MALVIISYISVSAKDWYLWIRALIEKLANESKHSTTEEEWYLDHPRGVKEMSNAHLESQISELTKVALLLTKERGIEPKVKPCRICYKTGHPTDICPILQEDNEYVQVMGGFQQKPFDQHRNNQAWGGPQNNNFQPRPQHNFQKKPISSSTRVSTIFSAKSAPEQFSATTCSVTS